MIDVALTPTSLEPADTIVVIDVLRATSTATQALASGYTGVIFVDSIARAHELRAPGRLRPGQLPARGARWRRSRARAVHDERRSGDRRGGRDRG
jgi:phosphosulfolactate phosphohydrolase-like enzyme